MGLIFLGVQNLIPSGKHTKDYGKSPFFMGKSVNQLFLWPFSIAMSVYQRVDPTIT